MQQPISRRDVYRPSLSASIGGSVVELESASVDRELPDPVSGGSLTAASVDLVAVEGPEVVSRVATPWDPGTQWPPVPETAVSVSMDTGAGPVSVLSGGRVMSASGGTGGRSVSVEAADRYQSLDRTISWDALADAMPLVEEGVGDRYVGFQSCYLTDRILRHCGWYATPPNAGYAALSVPAMGSVWPETGVADTSGRTSSNGGYPSWAITDWGLGVFDLTASFLLGGPAYSVKDRGRIEFVVLTDTTITGTNYLTAETTGGGGMYRLRWTQSAVYFDVRSGGSYTQAGFVTRVPGLTYVTAEYVTDASVRVTIRSGSNTFEATVTADATAVTSAARLASLVADSPVGGIQIAYPSTAGTLAGWTPNAMIHPRIFNRNALRAVKAVEAMSCVDLLQQQCEAEAATFWIDETGVLQWWDLARLEARDSVATLRSDDDIAEAGFTWSHDMSSVRSRALVRWKEPVATRRWRTMVDLWQGNGESLQPGEVDVEDWVNVPDDEVWISVDTNPKRVGTHSMEDFNGGIFSWYGAVISSAGTDPDVWAQSNGSLLMTIERVTDNAFKLVTEWHGDKVAIQKTAGDDAASALWKRRRSFDLPILRGRAKYTYLDRDTYSAQSGPVTAPEFVVDAGWWIQRPEQAQYLADYYGARVTVPQPVLSSVALIPVPGLQLGDVVEVRDEHVTQLTIRGIVTQDARSLSADMSMSHAVAIRPTSVTRNGVTWQEWAEAARPKTRAQWATNQGGTWTEWGANPLMKEDVI